MTNGEATITGLSEGRYEISAEATVTNATGRKATGRSKSALVLIVDNTPPSFTWILSQVHRSDGYIEEPLRHSLNDDREMIFLNGTPEAENKKLRKFRGMNVFNRGDFQACAWVNDATGLSKDLSKNAKVGDKAVSIEIDDASVSAPQRLTLFSGFSSLSESVTFNPETFAVAFCRGSYELNMTIQDRCGNKIDNKPQFRVWVDVTAPPAKVGTIPYQGSGFAIGEDGKKTQINPGRYVVSTADAADAWQNAYILLDTALPRLAGSPEGLPTSGSKNISAWLLNTPVPLPLDGEDTANIVMLDFAGNLTGNGTPTPKPVTFVRKPISETEATDAEKHGVSGTSEQPIYRLGPATPQEDSLYWLFEGGKNQDTSLRRPEGVRDVWKVKKTVSLQSGPTAKYTAILVNPLDVGPDGNDRHAVPQIMTVPSSWNSSSANQRIRVKDKGLEGFFTQIESFSANIVLGARRPASGGGNSFDQTLSTTAYMYQSAGLEGTMQVTHANVDPGLARVGYSVSASSTTAGQAPVIPYASITGFRWIDLIKVSPDVLVTGAHLTLRLEAGYLTKEFKLNDFDPKGDYVRFIGGSDVTQVASEWNSSALPTTRERKIAIVSQRLVAADQNASIKQAIELDVEIGPKVDPAIYHVDVKCGRVKAYTDDDLSAESVGANGAHRMKDALKIVKPVIVPTVSKYAECLRKRTGMADEPVIIMTSGGDKSVSNCSLVGYEEGNRNVWTFKAKCDPMSEDEPGDYTWVWDLDGGQITSGSAGSGQAGGDETISVKYRAGQYKPTLRVYRKVFDVKTLIGTASIHAINVYSKFVDGSEWAMKPIVESGRYGSEADLRRSQDESQGINVQVLVDTKAQGTCRARISPDGYPQNEYWVTSADNGDLPQPYAFMPNGSRKCWAQGYIDPSPNVDNLSLRVRSSKSYEDDSTTAKFSTILAEAAVDRNRDETISFSEVDRTSLLRPHVFWTNSDKDVEKFEKSQNRMVPQDDAPDGEWEDSLLSAIPNIRDLEDWMRLTIRVKGADSADKIQSAGLTLRLRTSGGLGIAYVLAREESGLNYLHGVTAAEEQISDGFGHIMGRVRPSGSSSTVSSILWNSEGKCPLLIEGTDPGNGKIICEILDGQRIVGRANVFMKLSHPSKLYEHWTVGDNATKNATIENAHLADDSEQYDKNNPLLSEPGNTKGLVFVHGWRMQPWERRSFAETALKRLYWAGYKGRFALFSWPTEYMEVEGRINEIVNAVVGNARNYDRSEFQARKVGRTKLAPWITERKAAWGCNHIDIMAHSMGNIVVCEALQAAGGAIVDDYFSCQSAEIGHTLNAKAGDFESPVKVDSENLGELTFDVEDYRADYLGPNLYKERSPINPRINSSESGGSTYHAGNGKKCIRFINCYNGTDRAMGILAAGQLTKPDVGYGYEFRHDHLPGWTIFNPKWKPEGYDVFLRGFTFHNTLNWPQDSAEILAFIVDARSVPMGSVSSRGGEVGFTVNLKTAIENIGKEHSAQFNLTIHANWSFWKGIILDKEFE